MGKGKIMLIVLVILLIAGYYAYDKGMLNSILGGKETKEESNMKDKPDDNLAGFKEEKSEPTNEVTQEEKSEPETVQEDIKSYTSFVGAGYTFSFPKAWVTEEQEDKSTMMAKSQNYDTNKASVAVQTGNTSKSLEDFCNSALDILWKAGNKVIVTDIMVGTFPAKEIVFINSDNTQIGKEIITVDEGTGTAYIMILKCLSADELKYQATYLDITTSFKLIEIVSDTPTLQEDIEVKENGNLFEETQKETPSKEVNTEEAIKEEVIQGNTDIINAKDIKIEEPKVEAKTN